MHLCCSHWGITGVLCHLYCLCFQVQPACCICAAAMADPTLGMGSPLWTLSTLTPPGPDLQRSTAGNSSMPAVRTPEGLLQPGVQSQSSWDHNNMLVSNKLDSDGTI